MVDNEAKRKQSKLTEYRAQLELKIRDLEREKTELSEALAKYEDPRHITSQEQLDETERYPEVLTEIAQLTEKYSNSILESLDYYLSNISVETTRMKWLTVALVFLTLILATFTGLDFLSRLGIIK